MIEKFMERIATDLHLEGSLALQDQPGSYHFPVDESLDVNIKELHPGLLFECQFYRVPKHNREQFFRRLLLANLFGAGTDWGVLGITKDENYLTLHFYLDEVPDFNEFDQILEDMLNAAEYWRDETKSIISSTEFA